MNLMRRWLSVVCVVMITLGMVEAQDWKQLDGDALFALAREKAFNGSREEARAVLLEILSRSPKYADVRILLARTYAWDGQREQARKELQVVLADQPNYEDAWNAAIDVEMWDDQYIQALLFANQALAHYPNQEDFLYKKSRILMELKRFDEAGQTAARLLAIDPSHSKGHALMTELKQARMLYTAGISYSLDLFSRSYDPANYLAAQLARTTSWGSAIVRLNYSDRFGTQGIQPEIDLYPKIANGVYAYINYGYSNNTLFPSHRIGGEIYSKLPKSFEASIGARYLDFNTSTVTIYTGSVGWYVKNYWLSFRPYITPGPPGTSVSGVLTVRKYFQDGDNYLGLSAGAGFSPDDRRIQSSNGLSTDGIYVLKSQRIGLNWQKTFPRNYQFIVNFSLVHQELTFDQGNYVWISSSLIGIRKRF
jgi:YaiO family outer membrane protein